MLPNDVTSTAMIWLGTLTKSSSHDVLLKKATNLIDSIWYKYTVSTRQRCFRNPIIVNAHMTLHPHK